MVVVVTTVAVGGGGGGGSAVRKVRGGRCLVLPQIPTPIQQKIQMGIMIGRNVHTRVRTTDPTMMPITAKT